MRIKKTEKALNNWKNLPKRKLYYDNAKINKVETLYRMLKQKYKEEHNDPEVSQWHYGEREMYRKGSRFRRYFPLSISNLYWLSSGYGERPARASIVLLCLVLSISFLMWFAGFAAPPEGNPATYSVDFARPASSFCLYFKYIAICGFSETAHLSARTKFAFWGIYCTHCPCSSPHPGSLICLCP